MKHRVKLEISYDGTEFEGWQRQPEGTRTVQAAIERALKEIFNKDIHLMGASRTDSGVHAKAQVAHFDCPKDPTTMKDLPFTLQSRLPRSVVVKKAWLAPAEFDALRGAESKIYQYYIHNAARPSALKRHYSYWIRDSLSLERLNLMAQAIEGTHDFASFVNSGSGAKTTERHIISAKWVRRTPSNLVFEVHGKGFLKQMVRNLVGTMTDLEMDGKGVAELKAIIEAKDRKKAGTTLPPQGLFLTKIFYPDWLDKKCRKL